MNTNKKKLITHNGSFHTDDVFAAAALILYLEKNSKNFSAQGGPASGWEIIRTRDPEIINTGDYVFDVGGIYDEKTNRFDHHQLSFTEKRPEGVLYSSFGLVWKKFGEELCDSKEAAGIIDNKLVAPIDANDNGFDLVDNKYNISSYDIEKFFHSMCPSWSENILEMNKNFEESVSIAKVVLGREIIYAKDFIQAQKEVKEIYQKANDKKMIILDKDYAHQPSYSDFPDLLFVIYPRESDGFWTLRAVRKDEKKFDNRKNLPNSWATLRDEELQKVTGVEDAVFCHRALFMAIAKSKEGAIALAQKALLEPSN